MSQKHYAVIPAGGAGTRLWPRSRRLTPKHTLPLARGGRTLLRDTYDRVRGLVDEVFIVTELSQREIISAALPEVDSDHMIIEPVARGTTNAYGLAALTLHQLDATGVMLAMASDHVVRGRPEVSRALRAALHAADLTDNLIAIGLKPRYPSTGLGYLHASRPGPLGTRRVQQFIEKPALRTAKRFLKSGGYYWNVAWFAWKTGIFLAEMQRHAPKHLTGLRKVLEARAKGDEQSASQLYRRLPVEVIDRSVMEKTDNLLLVPATFDWSDIGNWSELGDRVRADAHGNSVDGEAVLVDTTGSLIFGDRRLIAAIGVKDLIIVDTEDALLVVPRSHAQDVRKVVEALRRARKTRYL
ncbi:MAG TPA: sugar phosphate nucleotidyltransferase [Candidatus Dormibacteraeota bacterium]